MVVDKKKGYKFNDLQGKCERGFLLSSGVDRESEKVNALGYFQWLAHDNFPETQNQLQISNLCKSPYSTLSKSAPAFELLKQGFCGLNRLFAHFFCYPSLVFTRLAICKSAPGIKLYKKLFGGLNGLFARVYF